jgi:hypothetical protein
MGKVRCRFGTEESQQCSAYHRTGSRCAKQESDYDAQTQEPAFAKATAGGWGTGFLFHQQRMPRTTEAESI